MGNTESSRVPVAGTGDALVDPALPVEELVGAKMGSTRRTKLIQLIHLFRRNPAKQREQDCAAMSSI
jgi:hypothetical protein